MEETEICPHCGAKMLKYEHRMTPGLVKALIKTANKVRDKQVNIVSKGELELTHGEYGNYQKLRFHGLIAKNRINGEPVHGQWVLTKRGAAFLRNELSIPISVTTFRNKVVDHSDQRSFISEIMRADLPYFESKTDFLANASNFSESDVDDETGELVQKPLFDIGEEKNVTNRLPW